MALSFPSDLLEEFRSVGWASLTLSYGDNVSGQASGDQRVQNRRAPLWMLKARSRILQPRLLRLWKTRLDALENGRQLFWGFDYAAYYPDLYPDGAWPTGGAFDGLSAAIHAIPSAISLRVKQLPAGFTISEGDHIAFRTGADPYAYALHQAMETAIADGSGITPAFEVRPPIREGAAANDPVAVKRPSCAMTITPNSVSAPDDLAGTGVITFEAMQTPRAV